MVEVRCERRRSIGVPFAMPETTPALIALLHASFQKAVLRAAVLIAVLISTTAAPLSAQSVQTVDQGSFTISINGQRAGREDFRIATTPSGSSRDYIATATVVYGDRRLSPELHADTAGVPSFYTVVVRNAGEQQEQWSGNIVSGRVSAKIRNPRGESAKEFIVTDGALILDDDVFHQYFFVAHRSRNGSITAVNPRRNAQETLRVSSVGPDRVTIGTRDLEATHLAITDSGGQRDLWVDAQGRVLKVSIPARGVVALRDDPPR